MKKIIFTIFTLLICFSTLNASNSVKVKQASQNQTQQELNERIGQVYQSENENRIIKLGDFASKKTLVIFSDPECPACRKELSNIKATLAKNNVEIILLLVNADSADKIIQIYEELADAKNDNDKIKILKKYFALNAKAPKASQLQKEELQLATSNYLRAGLDKTPYKVEKEKLLQKD